MELSNFKKGKIVYRLLKKEKVVGPFRVLARSGDLLFLLSVEIPQDFEDLERFLTMIKPITVDGKRVQIIKVENHDNWFQFPVEKLEEVQKELEEVYGKEKPTKQQKKRPPQRQQPQRKPKPPSGPKQVKELPSPPTKGEDFGKPSRGRGQWV